MLFRSRQYLVNAMRIAEPEAKAAAAQIVKRIQVMIGRQNRRAAGNWTMHAFALDDDSALAFALAVEKAVMAELKVSQTKFIKRYVAPSPFAADPRKREDLVLQIYAPKAGEVWYSSASLASPVSLHVAGNRRDRKSTRLNSSHIPLSRMPSSA